MATLASQYHQNRHQHHHYHPTRHPQVTRLKDALQERKVGRGNIAQIQQAELTVAYVKDINDKLDAVMQHLNLSTPPLANNAEVMEREIGDFILSEAGTAIVTGRQVAGPVDGQVPHTKR